MICYHCTKADGCPVYRTLCSLSNDFYINDCRDYDDNFKYKYKNIVENDDLLKLIYDYFTGSIKNYADCEIKNIIKNELLRL